MLAQNSEAVIAADRCVEGENKKIKFFLSFASCALWH